MKWERLDNDAIQCGDYVIRRGGWMGGTVFRLFYKSKLLAICPTADAAKGWAETGMTR